MVRPERFELPTFWFVEMCARTISKIHVAAPGGPVWPNGTRIREFRLSRADCSLPGPSPAKQDFGHDFLGRGFLVMEYSCVEEGTMDTDNPKPTPGQQVKAALTAAMALPRPRPRPEFVAFVNSLDAMELHIARYLLHDLNVPSSLISALVPLIDPRCFEARLESEVADVLKALEDDGGSE